MPKIIKRMPTSYLENVENTLFPRGVVDDLLAEILGKSARQVRRYYRQGLPESLVPKIQEAVEQQAKALRRSVK